MSFWKIAWRSMQQRAVASSLTGLSMALGVAVMIAILVVHRVAVEQFSEDAQGYHLIVGAKGDKLQLVLNTVFHLSSPVENIPYSFYEEFLDGKFADYTQVAIPMCLGDSYEANGRRFRIVATTPDLFESLNYGVEKDGEPKRYAFQEGGRNFKSENFFEAVIGSVVARQSGLKVGDRFNATHGIGTDDLHDENAFTVVGVLERTGTANDRAVFINMEGFYLLANHSLSEEQAAARERAMEVERGVEETNQDDAAAAKTDSDAAGVVGSSGDDAPPAPLPKHLREVTAILVLSDNLLVGALQNMINEGVIAQAVFPAAQVEQLFSTFVRPIQIVLLTLTILTILVASVSILVSIYNSMNERSHDIAIMRALGASRSAVMMIILVESILLALGGGLLGVLLGHGLVAAASPYVEAQTGVVLHFWQFDRWEWIVIPSLVALASLVGLIPAIAAYRTDVADSLSGGR